MNYFVPVVDVDNQPLMPTVIGRAMRLVVTRKATPFYKKGIFCVRLNYRKPDVVCQDIAVGIDPGSKKEGITVKSASHTYLNLQLDAVTWVKDAEKTSTEMRKGRRFRNTPCRKPRWNRAIGGIPPSTKARWNWKLRIVAWLKKMFPVTKIIVEDIKAKSKGQRKWDRSFSPLQTGKHWFYEQLGKPELKEGWETKQLRVSLGLKKLSNKLKNDFHAHCVDSWVLANYLVGGHVKPDNRKTHYIQPLRFHRRQLHMLQPKNGIRKLYGGTRSLGLKRGSLVKNKKLGLCYVGGNMNQCISLHDIKSGQRLTQIAKVIDCKFLCFNSWIFM